MQVVIHKAVNQSNDQWNEVADLEVLIPPEKNNAVFVNDTLIPTISKTGFRAIGREVRWCKNSKGQDALFYFGATEGRTTLTKVIKRINRI